MSPALDPVTKRLPVVSKFMAVISFFPWHSANLSTWFPLSTSHTLTTPPSHPLTTCQMGKWICLKFKE